MTASPYTVLIVDDDEDQRLLMSIALPMRGFTVRDAGTIADARRILAAGGIDALVADLHLSDGSGLELLEGLECRPRVAIVASGSDGADDIARTRERGFAVHMVKPVDIDELAATLNRLLAA